MDGMNIRATKRIKGYQIRNLDPGTVVLVHDYLKGITQTCRVIQFGRGIRLQNIETPFTYISPVTVPWIVYYVEA